MDSALLVAEVSPDFYKDKIRYLWFKDNEILDSGITYKILSSFMLSDFIEELFIPNRLVIFDSENNQIECKFEIQLNVPPQISKQTTPADGDTLFGDFYTPFLFKWNSYDLDENDKIQNILQIDETFYHLGNLNQIMQSGFTPGKHTFRVIVKDNIGIMDSLDFREFFVVDTLEGK